ncbi:hypothetical protein [Sciscionella sediminilitoris]|uniref:hypothetical protein n=1 Tax=Sciscionella sediminilitoris TaxID=1445613 RepID=UPI0006898979|nr:hypothetical protein [Sciscionella sp. SE31]
MSSLIVPELDETPWPTLGPQLVAFLEERAVFGPGDLKGEPYRVSPEKAAILYRAYEVFPPGHRLAGHRRFSRVFVSVCKGLAKTELLGAVGYAELHPEAPVRCDGFDANGQPVGVAVNDPYIPLLAYTEEQSDELAYTVLYTMCAEGPDADLFDIGLDRIMRASGDGRAVSLAAAPSARDGARTTFQGFDEPHRMDTDRHRAAHTTMQANLPKRPMAQPWSLYTTTAYEPGMRSVAETVHDEAKKIAREGTRDTQLFFFHREAGPEHDLSTLEGRIAAVAEARGPEGEYGPGQFEAIARQWEQPGVDRGYLERVWLNRTTQSARQAFNAARWKAPVAEGGCDAGGVLEPGALITLGFDGARSRDSTGLMACDVASGLLVKLGHWPRPTHLDRDDEWYVPADEVDAVLDDAYGRFTVWRLYADPAYWWDDLRRWAERHGEDRVVSWAMNRKRAVGNMCRNFAQAIELRAVTHNGDPDLAAHVANARRVPMELRDDEGNPLWYVRKTRDDSPEHIDLAYAAMLAWEARGDALASGALEAHNAVGEIIRVR